MNENQKLGTIMSVYINQSYIDLKIVELYLALEYQQKKHQENQYRLYKIDGMSHKGLGRCKKRDIDIHKIQNDSHCHGYGQRPIFTKT